MYFQAKNILKILLLLHSKHFLKMFAHKEEFFVFKLYYNSYDNLIENNLSKNLFSFEIIIVF